MDHGSLHQTTTSTSSSQISLSATVVIIAMLGKLVHLSFDALLLSAFLAGIKRSTGLTPSVSKLANKDLRQLAVTYLEFGEWIMDLSIVVMGRSSICERKR